MKPVAVSFVIPAYNEEAVITLTLEKLKDYIAQHHAELGRSEVVVVAAGTDKTPQITSTFAEKFDAMQILTPTGRIGKGRDVRVGMQAARGKIQIFMDADLSTPLHHILPMVTALRNGKDVVVGTRHLSKIHKGLVRSVLSVASNLVIRIILLPRYRDTQCGFKGFTKRASQLLFKKQEIKSWGFDLEVLQYAKEARLKVKQLSINDWHEARGEDLRGEPVGSAAMATLRDLAKLRIDAWARSIKRHWLLWTVFAAAASFTLTLWIGLKQSVWFDEAYSISLIKQSYSDLISLTSVDAHPPLYYMVLKLWSEAFGMGEAVLRSFSAICGAMAVGVGLALTRRLFGLKAMVLATPLLVLSPYLLRYGFEIRMYAMASLIGIAATYVLIKALAVTNHKKLWWIVYALLVAIGMYTLYYMALIWIAHVVWLCMFSRKKTGIPFYKQPWILAYVGAILLYLPWIPTFIEQSSGSALSGISKRVTGEQITNIFSFMFTYQPHWALQPWGYACIYALMAFCLYVVIRAFMRAGQLRPYLWLLLLYFAVPIIVLAIGSIPPLRPLFLVRYTSHFIIAAPLLLAASLVIAFRPRIKYAVLCTLALTGVLIVGIYNLNQQGNYNFDTLSRPQTRQAVDALGNCEPGSVVMAGSPMVYFELLYYRPNCDVRFYSTHAIGSGGGYASIYQSPKQYYEGEPINATTVYAIYAGQHPELPSDFAKMSSQSFKEYRLDIYHRTLLEEQTR